ncbi:CGNR zinc finger domain-containing protein [Allokutzneria sp. NRRL B-24872]|uniref:CGNR zinc finger domain-containing protein n=1 Tax=Allokutzneria sp. NRRL B-24872 TaxID=1137961 RepID=UPI001FEFEF38|nr:CGNR zinc finger domain-containing protein [Allokutzneria sp. NRRL B-24872]
MKLDSYIDAGVLVAVDLANRLALDPDAEAEVARPGAVVAVLTEVLAGDPLSVEQVNASHVPAFIGLARSLRQVFVDLAAREDDSAAARLNALLAAHSAHPHLAKEGGVWRLHHHPAEVGLVTMWAAICAEALARLLAAGHAARASTCADPRCARAYVDTSRNATRRFCSTRCQNRLKTAELRKRKNASDATGLARRA